MTLESDLAQPAFGVEVSRDGRAATVAVTGELDLATVGRLRAAIPPLTAGDHLVLDLRRLAFMDSSGLRLVMQLDIRARAESWAVAVVRSPGPIERALELSRVGERVRVVGDPADAIP